MRRLAIMLLAAALFAGCSSSIPRLPAVFVPTEPPTAAPATAAPAAASSEEASSAAAALDTSAWTKLAPQGQGFSVLMPGQAASSTSPIKTPVGDASMTSWTYTDSAKTSFMVDRATFTKGALSGAPAKTILDQATTAIASTLTGAQVSGKSDATLGGHSGRAFTFGNATTAVPCEFFIVGDDVYIVLLSHAAGSADDALAQAFFASFQLTV